jgi:hypothetical protein
MNFFKYCGESGLFILKNLEIKLTPPIEFNDPFEFSPVLRCKDPKGYAERAAETIIKDPAFFTRNRGSFPYLRNFREFQRYARKGRGKICEVLQALVPKKDSHLRVLELISLHFGVVCFSIDPVHPLMCSLRLLPLRNAY